MEHRASPRPYLIELFSSNAPALVVSKKALVRPPRVYGAERYSLMSSASFFRHSQECFQYVPRVQGWYRGGLMPFGSLDIVDLGSTNSSTSRSCCNCCRPCFFSLPGPYRAAQFNDAVEGRDIVLCSFRLYIPERRSKNAPLIPIHLDFTLCEALIPLFIVHTLSA